jgi:hypothetical protein
LRFIDSTGEGHIDPKTGIYVGDKDGECEDGLCWDEKNQAWVDNVPVNGGTVHETYDQTSSTPLIAGGVLVWEFAPPQVKVAAAGMGVLVGTALLAAYLDRDVINLAAPFTGPTTLPNSPRIDIVSPKPPPAPISKKKGEKRQVRAAARAAHMNYVQMRNAIHRWKADRGLPPNWKMSWEDLLAAAEEYRQLVEKRK